MNFGYITARRNKKWIRSVGHPVKEDGGNVRELHGVVMDTTYKKETQLQIQEYLEEIQNNKNLLNETGNMAKVGGWEYYFDTQKVYWTDEVFGIHEIQKTNELNFDSIMSVYSEQSKIDLFAAIDKAVADKAEYDLEIVATTPAGKNKWIRGIGKPIINSKGVVIGLRGTVQDINEKKIQELEIKESINTIQEQNKKLQNFAHITSHDLRTHAGKISAVVDLIGKVEDIESKLKLVKILQTSSALLNDTINNLHSVIRNTTEGGVMVMLNFRKVYNDIINLLHEKITAAEITIQADFSHAENIEYIPAYLESILLNLISNSIKYSSPYRKSLVNIRTFIKDHKTFLEISDNGIGIDMNKNRDKVFGLYNTFNKNEDARGVGLHTLKNQIEELGGFISLKSTLDVGSTFLIQF